MHWLDPDNLPHVTSNVECFLFNPHGEVDGMILANGLEVHSPPHLSHEVCAKIQLGDRITVFGVRPRSADMIAAVAIDTMQGQRIMDNGPPERHTKEGDIDPEARDKAAGTEHWKLRAEAKGLLQRALHGPKGETRGCLLQDGTIVRLAPHEADSVASFLRVTC